MKTSDYYFHCLRFLALSIIGVLLLSPSALSQDNFKLQPGAKGELCLKCHEDFKNILARTHLHPLLKKGECSGCHSPHTSDHARLLTADVTRLCINCHKSVLPEKANSVHSVVAAGECKTCHDPHGSNNPFTLVRSGNDLCLDCHKDVGEIVQNALFKHEPMRRDKGCLNCHSPHASVEQNFLLRNNPPALCKTCHQTDQPVFAQKHQGYPVADSNCVSCHSPHGSSKRGILYADAHAPVRDNKCEDCHEAPTSPDPLKTKKQGTGLCRQCHNDTIDQMFSKNRLHWPLADKTGCLNCHAPHGAKQKKLLKGPVGTVCGTCHADTLGLQKLSINNPKNKKLCEPVKTGNCTACHSPHSTDNALLFARTPVNAELCGKCHEWQTHSTHPIGEKVIDQRNKNLSLDCLSCHRACGTGNKPAMLHFETTYELCIQCHVDRKR